MKTNWSNRWITNLIEVTMPVNRFVNEYRTNYTTQFHTNLVALNAVQTNYVIAFKTNWNMVTVTNRVAVEDHWTNTVVVYQTNRVMRTQTNYVAVNLVRTNFVDSYDTNWNVLNLTNRKTVVLFKTNWITQVVTNTVEVEAPSPVAAATAAAPQALGSAAGWSGQVAIDAVRTARLPASNLVEVQLKARWITASAAPLHVQQWRVEREDAAVLLFGQDQEFKRLLPPGKYKVEARLKSEGGNPPLIARGTLSVSPQDVVVEPRLLVKK